MIGTETETTVEAVMTTPTLTVDTGDRPAGVARAMLESGVNSVVVIDADCRSGWDPHDDRHDRLPRGLRGLIAGRGRRRGRTVDG